VPEKPDMQDFVRDKPWLMNPQWDVLQHERSLDKVLAEEFSVQGDPDYEARMEASAWTSSASPTVPLAVVAGLKRPDDLIGLDELRQVAGYVDYLRRRERESNDPDHPSGRSRGASSTGSCAPTRRRRSAGCAMTRSSS
jgi:hypothetical protein